MRTLFSTTSVICLLVVLLLQGLVLTFAIRTVEGGEPCPEPFIESLIPQAGNPGDEMKLVGASFGHKKGKVIFYPGVHAEIISWDNENVLLRVPDGAESGMVWMYVPCGQHSNEHYFTMATDVKLEEQEGSDDGLSDESWQEKASDEELADKSWEEETSDDGLTDESWEEETTDDGLSDESWEEKTTDDGLGDESWEE